MPVISSEDMILADFDDLDGPIKDALARRKHRREMAHRQEVRAERHAVDTRNANRERMQARWSGLGESEDMILADFDAFDAPPGQRRSRRGPACVPCAGLGGNVAVEDVILGDLDDLSRAVTAAARARAGAAKPAKGAKDAKGPKGGKGGQHAKGAKVGSDRLNRTPTKKLEPIVAKKEAQLGRDKRRTTGQLTALDKKINTRKVAAGDLPKAMRKRRELGAKATTEHLRRKRAGVAKRFLQEAKKEKRPEVAQALHRAATAALTTPLKVEGGRVRPVCPRGYALAQTKTTRTSVSGLEGFGDLGYPGSTYVPGNVPQYSTFPHDWRSPAHAMRAAFVASVGAPIEARPGSIDVPSFHPMPVGAMKQATANMPSIAPAPWMIPPRAGFPGMPKPPQRLLHPPGKVPPALLQNPLYKPGLMPPSGNAARHTATDITVDELGGLGEDIILADAWGAFAEVEEQVLAGFDGLDSLMGFDDLGRIGDKVKEKLSTWGNRLKAHQLKLGRGAVATLVATSMAAGGMPLIGAGIGKKIMGKEAIAQGDEEAEFATSVGQPVRRRRKSRHVRKINARLLAEGRNVRCVKI